MKGRKELLHRAAVDIELPGEMIPGVPLVEIFGNGRVLIENHLSVIGYNCQEISVCTQCGALYIQGSKLVIARMTRYQLVITGKIDAVRLTGE